MKTPPPPTGEPARRQSSYLLPIVLCDKRKSLKCTQFVRKKNISGNKQSPEILTKRKTDCPRSNHLEPCRCCSCPGSSTRFWQELPSLSHCQEVHHLSIASFHREKLKDLHMPVSAPCPSRGHSNLLPEHCLLVFPLAAVAEEIHTLLQRSASTPPALVLLLVSKPL